MQETTKGFWAIVAACVVWGLSGIYYKALSEVPPTEVLAHRTIWSAVFLGAVVAAQGRGAVLWAALRSRALRVLLVAAVVISINWFGFIWSVQNGHAVEASLGYYIFPLVAVALGMAVFGEKMGRAQGMAVAIAAVAVGYLTWALGAAPWIALLLAGTFGLYGLIKKRIEVPPVISVLAEVVILVPLAVGLLAAKHFGWFGLPPHSGAFGQSLSHSVMLAFSGILTGGPLMLFSYAARRVRMATLGLVQYLNPTLQFLVAVVVFAEPFTAAHAVAFPLIWGALALYSAASLRRKG
ncbi:chloramphenicol-sensitive protein RarD [Rhodobacter aestuarii]|uniref:Chloramphenicol-sensitive protein RarD n=1 Tax=Rhodobacter aestuarii TaxID=453582 RepID=A0A1N7J169_9RHOB|nr:EamA family transporter RarD [Rhodobacter aestuarii]PTV97296.1 chloramphenicol-sensitive protein RarD [Rhodobacter aestuarii]SIS43118.1 chloramphenicol-sensitive protein RarD [Rhodobacter aestuarii]